MPKKPKLVVTPKLAGQKVALVGRLDSWPGLEKLAVDDGAQVVDPEKVVPDLIVHGYGKVPAIVAKVQKKNPAAKAVNVTGFYHLIAYTADELLEILEDWPNGWERWSDLQPRLQPATPLTVANADLTDADLSYARLDGVTFDDVDLRHACLDDAGLGKLRNVKLDEAYMESCSVSDAEDCSFKKADLTEARFNPGQFVRCDFTGATLEKVRGGYTRAAGCVFKKANCAQAEFEQSDFTGCDFSGAKCVGAKFAKADLTGADLTGADCTRADFRDAKFIGANLRKVNFCDAILAGADFTGATIAGADFTGANLAGAIAGGVDASKAKNFAPVAARAPGPRMTELAKVAKQSKRINASIELGLKGKEYVILDANASTYGTSQYVGANHTHCSKDCTYCSYVEAPTFEQGMLNLADLWAKGTPRLDTVKVTSKKCPLKSKELVALARDAWCEALGVAPPTAAEVEAQEKKLATATDKLRDRMLAELRGGATGVKKFNARDDKDREKIGKLHKLDFTKAKLSGARLYSLDMQGTTFDGATLTKAAFGGTKLQNASFVNVKAGGANFAGCKAADASFGAATLTKCSLRAASFLRADFKSADLTGAEFDYSDLCGADFTRATLTKVSFKYAKFDAATKFPAGFIPPDDMIWRGGGPHPGKLSAVATTAVGGMDFDTFVKGLAAKVDAARVAKAAAMLKAERFQLYADVTDAAVAGIVKSQTSKDLLYSCRLAADGTFGCGT